MRKKTVVAAAADIDTSKLSPGDRRRLKRIEAILKRDKRVVLRRVLDAHLRWWEMGA
jgi:hypothetical protein